MAQDSAPIHAEDILHQLSLLPEKEDFLDQLRPDPPSSVQTVNCPICEQPYTSATTTSCQHTFCLDCLTHWLDVKGHNHCPSCRKRLFKQYVPVHDLTYDGHTTDSDGSEDGEDSARTLPEVLELVGRNKITDDFFSLAYRELKDGSPYPYTSPHSNDSVLVCKNYFKYAAIVAVLRLKPVSDLCTEEDREKTAVRLEEWRNVLKAIYKVSNRLHERTVTRNVFEVSVYLECRSYFEVADGVIVWPKYAAHVREICGQDFQIHASRVIRQVAECGRWIHWRDTSGEWPFFDAEECVTQPDTREEGTDDGEAHLNGVDEAPYFNWDEAS